MSKTKTKNNPPKPNGRPPLPKLTDYQREVKNKLLRPLLPIYPLIINKLQELACVKSPSDDSLQILQTGANKKYAVPIATQERSCKTLLDQINECHKIVYGSGVSSEDDEETNKIKEPARVLSLVVQQDQKS